MTLHAIPAGALDKHIAILGKTGSGKTNAAKVTVERLLDHGERVCILDPTAAWWGLRSNAAGDGEGYPVVVFGGEHGDVPLAGAHGAAIAEIIGTSSTPAVIDTRLLTVGERTRLFTDFAEALIRKNKGPLHLVIDEAHLFAPQGRVADPQSGRMLHAANSLVSMGRSLGLRIILISQRPAKLHKDSLTQVETLVALRLIAPQDRRAVEDWIGEWADPKQGKDLIASLPSLKTGEGWIWSPELGVLDQVKFPLTKTFDSAKAPSGKAKKGPVLAPIDLETVHARLEQVKIDAKANDIPTLKRRIAELERGSTSTVTQKIVPDPEAYAKGEKVGRLKAVKAIAKLAEDMAKSVARAEAGCADARRLLDAFASFIETQADAMQAPPPPARISPHALAPRKAPELRVVASDDTLTGPQAQFLKSLAWWKAMGHLAPTRVQLASIAGWRVTSGHLKNVAGSLRTKCLIDYPTVGTIKMTEAGEAVAPEPDLATNLIDSLRAILSGPQRQVFEALLSKSAALTREELAQACGWEPTSGHIKNVLGSMRSLEIITYPSQGVVALDDWVQA